MLLNFAVTANTKGAPSFAYSAKGRSWNVDIMERTKVVLAASSRSCNESKDGAPLRPEWVKKIKNSGWASRLESDAAIES